MLVVPHVSDASAISLSEIWCFTFLGRLKEKAQRTSMCLMLVIQDLLRAALVSSWRKELISFLSSIIYILLVTCTATGFWQTGNVLCTSHEEISFPFCQFLPESPNVNKNVSWSSFVLKYLEICALADCGYSSSCFLSRLKVPYYSSIPLKICCWSVVVHSLFCAKKGFPLTAFTGGINIYTSEFCLLFLACTIRTCHALALFPACWLHLAFR